MLKIGPFAQGQGTDTNSELYRWLNDYPPSILKLYAWGHRDPNNPVPEQENFDAVLKIVRPETTVIIKPMESVTLRYDLDPVVEAGKYHAFAFAGLSDRYKTPALKIILEATNETGIPAQEKAMMQWHSRFMAEVARLTFWKSGGLIRAGIGAWATGNPSGTAEDPMCQWEDWTEALDAIAKGWAVLTLHEYGTKLAPQDTWNLLRYRRVLDRLVKMGYRRQDIKIAITEFAYDTNPEYGTYNRWRNIWHNDIAAHWRDWVRWYVSEIHKDPEVIGATWYSHEMLGTSPEFDLKNVGLPGVLRDVQQYNGAYRVNVGAAFLRNNPGTDQPVYWFLVYGQTFRAVAYQDVKDAQGNTRRWFMNCNGRWISSAVLTPA